jgi:PTS system galactitol-specific IIB component
VEKRESMMQKLIWVGCGSGVGSSVMAAEVLKPLCAARGLDVRIEIVNFRDLRGMSRKPDLMVSIAPGLELGNPGLVGVPVVIGVSMLTGIGIEKTMDEIEKALKGSAEER